MKRGLVWEVVSPEYQTHGGGDFEPPEYGRDVLWVKSRSKARARVLALRAWRRQARCVRVWCRPWHPKGAECLTCGGRGWRLEPRWVPYNDTAWAGRGENPFAGMQAYRPRLEQRGWYRSRCLPALLLRT